MGFWDSFGSGDSSDFWSGFGDGGVLDSGGGGDVGSWTDYLGGDWGDGSGSFLGDLGSGGSGSSGSSGSSFLSSLFGGGGQSGGSGSNIFGSLLAGLGGAADNYEKGVISKEAVQEQGKQQRKTAGFEADLLDYYKQKDKVRKRTALDTYGQFSTLNRYAPNYQAAPAIDMPAKPSPGS
jgi:hypothetical protein